MRTILLCLLGNLAIASFSGFAAAEGGPPLTGDKEAVSARVKLLSWSLGNWGGVRRDGASGKEYKASVRVEAILGGAALAEHLEVDHGDSVYRGLTVLRHGMEQTGTEQKWSAVYMNSTRSGFVQLEGIVTAERSTWGSTSSGQRLSRLVSEPRGNDSWRRTMSVSEDGGKTWRVLWTDELRRLTPKQAT